jgi:hypothetical protein
MTRLEISTLSGFLTVEDELEIARAPEHLRAATRTLLCAERDYQSCISQTEGVAPSCTEPPDEALDRLARLLADHLSGGTSLLWLHALACRLGEECVARFVEWRCDELDRRWGGWSVVEDGRTFSWSARNVAPLRSVARRALVPGSSTATRLRRLSPPVGRRCRFGPRRRRRRARSPARLSAPSGSDPHIHAPRSGHSSFPRSG